MGKSTTELSVVTEIMLDFVRRVYTENIPIMQESLTLKTCSSVHAFMSRFYYLF